MSQHDFPYDEHRILADNIEDADAATLRAVVSFLHEVHGDGFVKQDKIATMRIREMLDVLLTAGYVAEINAFFAGRHFGTPSAEAIAYNRAPEVYEQALAIALRNFTDDNDPTFRKLWEKCDPRLVADLSEFDLSKYFYFVGRALTHLDIAIANPPQRPYQRLCPFCEWFATAKDFEDRARVDREYSIHAKMRHKRNRH